jgi:hypothetical protein
MHARRIHAHGRLTNGYGGARGWSRAPRRVAPGGIPDARGRARARARRGYARCLNPLGWFCLAGVDRSGKQIDRAGCRPVLHIHRVTHRWCAYFPVCAPRSAPWVELCLVAYTSIDRPMDGCDLLIRYFCACALPSSTFA